MREREDGLQFWVSERFKSPPDTAGKLNLKFAQRWQEEYLWAKAHNWVGSMNLAAERFHFYNNRLAQQYRIKLENGK